MRHIFFSILASALFFSCGGNATVDEKGASADSSKKGNFEVSENVAPEILALLEEVKKNPDDHEGNSEKLNRVATAFISTKKTRQGVNLLKQAIRNHYSSSNTAQNAFDLMNVYKAKYADSNNHGIMAQALKIAFPSFNKMSEVEKLIPKDAKAIVETISDIRQNMTDKETGRLDLKQANKYINYTEIYALMQPKEKVAPELLQKAGEVARSIRAYPKSIEIYDWILEKYGTSTYASQALFMKAFTFDNELNDKRKAKAYYEEFLKKYPDDSFADDTKFLLDNIGKTNEDIIKGFNNTKGGAKKGAVNGKPQEGKPKKVKPKKEGFRDN